MTKRPPPLFRHELLQPYLEAQLAGDYRKALEVAIDQGVHAGVAVPDLHLRVVQPAQHEIGRLWQENRISVAQEHLATSISQLVVSHLYQHMPRERPNGKRALVACVEGEQHDVGARMGADFLEMAGFEVRFLGANVPVDAIVLEAASADLLGLSASMLSHAPALTATVKAVRQAKGGGFPVVVGGNLVNWAPELGAALKVAAVGTCAAELVARCRSRLRC
ncbi:MAG TPA: cobalamin-dependent protein [Polyangiaceae bacterium]|nr:cobalamin-dependent protein [Polyangiaceae bacterium]